MKKNKKTDVMGVIEHLAEFRKRLIIVIVYFAIITLVSFNFSDNIVKLMIESAQELGYQLVYLAPGELLSQYIKLSIICGIVFSSPIILVQTWSFIRPGLKKSESTIGFLTLFAGLICFLIGAIFSYIIVMPLILSFFINIDQYQTVAATISIQNYLNFVFSTLISFGIVFEMPIITVMLTQIGLLKPQWLIKSRRIVIVVIFVVGAIITPPDIISQILISIPMLILFEISIILSKIINRKKIKKDIELGYD
ncbi:MAG: twin-arginine translocase subunit TatC [Eubacteriaceae bacterium]